MTVHGEPLVVVVVELDELVELLDPVVVELPDPPVVVELPLPPVVVELPLPPVVVVLPVLGEMSKKEDVANYVT